MICRRIKKEDNKYNVVWFGSYGKNQDGTAKFYNPNYKHDNYADQQDGTRDSLTQHLSVIRQELWYNINYGLPLLENSSKLEMDAAIADIISAHPDVQLILEFESTLFQHQYHAEIKVQSVFGEISLSI